MKIAVWKTGHEIADTVAQALAEGFDARIYNTNEIASYKRLHQANYECGCVFCRIDVHVAYGILRGTSDVFRLADGAEGYSKRPWFNVDRGYFQPSHYDGYYRISHKGTQTKYDAAYPITREYQGELKPIRPYDKSKPILACPPTQAVVDFFGGPGCFVHGLNGPIVIRRKGDPTTINWDDYSACVTFNSSVGWKALINGVPCLSDPTHSVVGSYYNTKSIDECVELFHNRPRKPLLDFMASHQFTLDEVRQGLAWNLVNHYLSGSAMTAGKQSVPMYAPTA